MQEPLITVAITLITAAFSAWLAIHLKFSTSKEEALEGLKKLATDCLFAVWVGWLIYRLFKEVLSSDELSRYSVFQIVLYSICVVVMFFSRLMRRTLDLIENMIATQDKHVGVTERLLDQAEQKEPNNQINQGQG